MAASLKASQSGLEIVDQARRKKGWNATAQTWCDAAQVSEATLKRFRQREAISQDAFIGICQAVGIEDWQAIVDDTPKPNPDSPSPAAAKQQMPNQPSESTNPNPSDQPPHSSEEQSRIQQTIFSNIDVGGNFTTGNITIGDITQILTNDDPRKTEQAKKLYATEIQNNILNIDARLGFVEQALIEDPVEAQLRSIRRKVAPAWEQTASSGYNRLLLQQTAATLRQALNSRPLKTEVGTLLRDLLAENVVPWQIQSFYDRLTDVQDASESLLSVLSDAASRDQSNIQVIEYYERRITLEVNRLKNRSIMAHLSGLRLLNALAIESSEPNSSLKLLTCLEPRQLIDNNEIEALLTERVTEAGQLMLERAALLEEGQSLLHQSLKAYEDLNQLLEIKPTDPWNVVVGKAVSLRQLGRTTEAVAAFARYGDMFAATDPTARQFTRTAQQFTQQLNHLGLEGGIYIYELVDNGAAIRAGVEVGDIVIGYGDRSIKGMDDLVAALRDAPVGEPVRITLLRMQADGSFIRHMKTVVAGSLGAGFMPI